MLRANYEANEKAKAEKAARLAARKEQLRREHEAREAARIKREEEKRLAAEEARPLPVSLGAPADSTGRRRSF